MGSIVEFNCRSCGFTTENLRVGWGKEGRTRFWGGLGLCPACKRLSVVDLSAKLDMHRCKECQGQLTLLGRTLGRLGPFDFALTAVAEFPPTAATPAVLYLAPESAGAAFK